MAILLWADFCCTAVTNSSAAGQMQVCLPFPVSSKAPGRPSLDMSKTGKGPRVYSALDEEDDLPVDLTDAPITQVTPPPPFLPNL